MNILEMLEKLKENPNKKFTNNRANKGSYVALDEDKTLCWFGEGQRGQPFLVNFLKDDEWEEVKEPVTFMEAVASGKNIGVEHGKTNHILEFTRYRSLESLLYELQRNLDSKGIADVLQNGRFYISD